MNNLFRDISCGKNPPQEINVVVEIAKEATSKYEIDEESGAIFLDRTLYGPQIYPFEYGFVPQTRSGDGDSLDIILLASRPSFPGCVVKARPIGLMYTEDEAGIDNKIIAVPLEKIDPRFKEIQDIKDLSEHQRKEVQEFFETYKRLEPNKWVKITGWGAKDEALKIIEQAVVKYRSE